MQASEQIATIKRKLGQRLLILGHYYQRDKVLQHADAVGDSLELARRAAREQDAERIVFCGVHFMAESADILTDPRQQVYMPDMAAGCPMADMAPLRELRKAWEELQSISGDWLPVIYVNSSAAAKAFCGAHGGCTCTSSNASQVMQWVFEQGKRVLFLPDEHLARNTAHDLGLDDTLIATFDPGRPMGGLTEAALSQARVLAWKGYCHVHAFTVEQIQEARRRYPDAHIIVHPETPAPVLRLADAHGSTSQIIKYVEAAQDGSTIVIGTEFNLVSRLGRTHRDRLNIVPLRVSVCPNMALTNESKLMRTLQDWPENNLIRVDETHRTDARKALARMLQLA
ncbi:MAG: quinolinate synthase NadA [Kiritimatiellia bacterium]|nr:quinolinate synthase NadA [Lentisphaerota bacterium]